MHSYLQLLYIAIKCDLSSYSRKKFKIIYISIETSQNLSWNQFRYKHSQHNKLRSSFIFPFHGVSLNLSRIHLRFHTIIIGNVLISQEDWHPSVNPNCFWKYCGIVKAKWVKQSRGNLKSWNNSEKKWINMED